MHRCRHELKEDPYASGAENRRENRDRLNEDVALHDSIRQAVRIGYRPPYDGHMGMLGQPYGLGYGGYVSGPPFSPYDGPYGYPGLPGPYGKALSPLFYDDDYDSDNECPSTWYLHPPPPPPHFTTMPLCTSRRSRRSRFGGRCGSGLSNPWAGSFEHEHYHIPPRSFMAHVGRRY